MCLFKSFLARCLELYLIQPSLQLLPLKSISSSPKAKISFHRYLNSIVCALHGSQAWLRCDCGATICQMTSKISTNQSSTLHMPYYFHFISRLNVAQIPSRLSFSSRRPYFIACKDSKISAISSAVSDTFITFETDHLNPSTSHTMTSRHYSLLHWLTRSHWSLRVLCKPLTRCRSFAVNSLPRMSRWTHP